MHDPTHLQEQGYSRPAVAAQFAGVSRATMYRWAAEGRFPRPIQLSPGVSGVRNRDLIAWADDPQGWASQHRNTPIEQAAA